MLRFVLLPLLACLPHIAQANPQVLSAQAGFLCNVHEYGSEPAAGTLEGRTDLIDSARLRVMPTTIVPATLGVHAGILLHRDPAYTAPLRVVVTHPPMGSDGMTEQSFFTNQPSDGKIGAGWQFEYDYELLPGPWSITLLDGDTLLYRFDFTVVPPAAFPPDITICDGGPELLS